MPTRNKCRQSRCSRFHIVQPTPHPPLPSPRCVAPLEDHLTSMVMSLLLMSSSGRSLMSLSRLHLRAQAMAALTMEGPRAPLSRSPWYDATSSPSSFSPCNCFGKIVWKNKCQKVNTLCNAHEKNGQPARHRIAGIKSKRTKKGNRHIYRRTSHRNRRLENLFPTSYCCIQCHVSYTMVPSRKSCVGLRVSIYTRDKARRRANRGCHPAMWATETYQGC